MFADFSPDDDLAADGSAVFTDPLPIIFSLEDGFVWVTLGKGQPAIKLGRYDEVIAGMRDFVAQSDIAEGMLAKFMDS